MQTKQYAVEHPHSQRDRGALNGIFHRPALIALAVVVVGHWGEHLVQGFQIWGLHWPRERSLGLLGLAAPWLVKSEQLHYWIALVMLMALLVLRPTFTGPARAWWDVAFGIQLWHHLEHLLLFGQVLVSAHLLGRPVPTSIVQLAVPRVELHLVYNAIVTGPDGDRRLPAHAAPPAGGDRASLYLLPAALAAACRRLDSDG